MPLPYKIWQPSWSSNPINHEIFGVYWTGCSYLCYFFWKTISTKHKNKAPIWGLILMFSVPEGMLHQTVEKQTAEVAGMGYDLGGWKDSPNYPWNQNTTHTHTHKHQPRNNPKRRLDCYKSGKEWHAGKTVLSSKNGLQGSQCFTLPETNSSHQNIGRFTQKGNDRIPSQPMFRCEFLLVSGSGKTLILFWVPIIENTWFVDLFCCLIIGGKLMIWCRKVFELQKISTK